MLYKSRKFPRDLVDKGTVYASVFVNDRNVRFRYPAERIRLCVI